MNSPEVSHAHSLFLSGGGAGGRDGPNPRLLQQFPRESALASAMRSVRAAQRPSALAASTAPTSAAPGFPSGLSFTSELSARQAVLQVLAKHNASASSSPIAHNYPLQFSSNFINPSCLAAGVPLSNEPSASVELTAHNLTVPKRTASPAVSKKALLMKRACLEAEARPLPPKKVRRNNYAEEDVSQPQSRSEFSVASSADEENDSDSDTGDSKALIPPGVEGITAYADDDVLCGRGGGTNVHPGNRRFRDLIHANRRRYLKAKKNDKPAISRSIVRSVRKAGGRFLRKDEAAGLWYEIGDAGAREKTSQALRQRAPEMRKILFEDETRGDGLHRSAVVEAAAAAAARGLGSTPQSHLRQPLHQPLAAAENDGLAAMLAPPAPSRQGLAQANSVAPVPHMRHLTLSQEETNAFDFSSLPQMSSPAQIQAPMGQIPSQPQQQPQQQQHVPYQTKDMLLQAQLEAMHPHAAFVQRNAQTWTTQTLLGRGINTFTPNIA